jgi:hypothetical protein
MQAAPAGKRIEFGGTVVSKINLQHGKISHCNLQMQYASKNMKTKKT